MTASVPVCPHCATASEIPLACERCGWRWYRNPSPAAGSLVEVMLEGEPAILLLQRAVDPGRGRWDLPAGYLEEGESAEEGALRETREEAGFAVRLERLVGVYSGLHSVSIIYLARPVEANPVVNPDAEASAHAWVRRSEAELWIPRMAFPAMAAAVADWAAGRSGVPATR